MSAVLNRPRSLSALLGRPGNELEVISRGRAGRALSKLPAMRVDDHRRVAALVRVDPNHHHHPGLSFQCRGSGSVGGHIPVGATPRSSQATPAGPTIAVRAAQPKPATKAINNLERARTADSL